MKVHFGRPEHGWMKVTITQEDGEFSFPASYISVARGQMEDSISELVSALLLMLNNVQGIVHWFSEPTEYQFIFSPENDLATLTILEIGPSSNGRESREILRFHAALYDVCKPFWKAWRDLETGQSPIEYETSWMHSFPTQEMKRLTQMMYALKQKR
jgi:hypothetical protein